MARQSLLLPTLALAAAGLLATNAARAAESYDGCGHFIDTVPATLNAPGVWCLRKDVSTAITSGVAITIAANNVTLDCNDFRIGGLAAGSVSMTSGVGASNRQNATIRGCAIRGFHRGVSLYGGNGHLIERNRLDNNLVAGIHASNVGNTVIRDNRVYDTGGYADNYDRYGIYAYGGDGTEVSDNTVNGVFGTPGYFNGVVGIFRGNYEQNVDLVDVRIVRNRISGLVPSGAGKTALGFDSINYGSTYGRPLFADNHVSLSAGSAGSIGVRCLYGLTSMRGNTLQGFATAFSANCRNDGGNVAY